MADVAELGFKVDSRDVVTATDRLEKLSDAAGKSETATQRMSRHFEDVGRKLQGFGDSAIAVGGFLSTRVTAPMLAAATAAGAFAVKFASAADNIAKTADKIGVGTEALQELRFAAERGGVAPQVLDTALQRMARRTAEAAQGTGTLVKVMEQYGISATDVAGNSRRAEDVIGDIADAMDQASSEGEKLRIAIAAFDTEGAGMVNVLRGGSAALEEMRDRARELGGVIGEETLRESERFQDSVTDLQMQMSAAANAVGTALIPALNALIPVISEKVIPAIVAAGEGIARLIEWFAALPAPVQEAAGIVAAVLGTAGPIALAIGALSKLIGGLLIASGPVGLLIAAATALYIAWQIWGDEFTALAVKTVDFVTNTFTAFVERVKAIFAGVSDAITSAFLGPLGRIQSATEAATTKIADTWAWLSDTLVGNSIIPDMNEAIEDEFDRHYAVLGEKNAAAVGAMRDQFEELRRVLTANLELGAGVTEEDRRADEYADRLEFLRAALEAEAITRAEFREMEMLASQEFDLWRQEQAVIAADRQIEEAQRVADAEAQMHAQRLAGFSSFFGNLATATAAGGKKTFALFKAFAIAQAVIDAIAAAQGAYKVGASIGGPKLGAAFAAAAAAAQGARLAQIRATDYTGTASSNAGSRGGSGGSPAPVAPPAPRAQDVTIRLDSNRTLFSRGEIEQILEGLNDAIADGAQIRVAR